MTNDGVRQRLEFVNARLTEFLEGARRALRGKTNFGPEEVRRLRQPVEEMAPIVAKSAELRRLRPELAAQLDLYKTNLGGCKRRWGRFESCCWRGRPARKQDGHSCAPFPSGSTRSGKRGSL